MRYVQFIRLLEIVGPAARLAVLLMSSHNSQVTKFKVFYYINKYRFFVSKYFLNCLNNYFHI